MSLAERLVQIHERRLDDLEDLLRELLQRQRAMSSAMAGGGGGGEGGGGSVRVAKATTAITASSATTPGSGTVQPLKLTGGNYADDGAAVDVKNAGAAISSGKRVLVLDDAAGVPWATPEECE